MPPLQLMEATFRINLDWCSDAYAGNIDWDYFHGRYLFSASCAQNSFVYVRLADFFYLTIGKTSIRLEKFNGRTIHTYRLFPSYFRFFWL